MTLSYNSQKLTCHISAYLNTKTCLLTFPVGAYKTHGLVNMIVYVVDQSLSSPPAQLMLLPCMKGLSNRFCYLSVGLSVRINTHVHNAVSLVWGSGLP